MSVKHFVKPGYLFLNCWIIDKQSHYPPARSQKERWGTHQKFWPWTMSCLCSEDTLLCLLPCTWSTRGTGEAVALGDDVALVLTCDFIWLIFPLLRDLMCWCITKHIINTNISSTHIMFFKFDSFLAPSYDKNSILQINTIMTNRTAKQSLLFSS